MSKEQDPFYIVLDQIEEMIRNKSQSTDPTIVQFSAYEQDDDGNPINNLMEIPIEGKFKIRQKADEFWGGEDAKDWESPLLDSPTWLDLCMQAEAMMKVTLDDHHCFLENITPVSVDDDGTVICEFSMGS